MINENWEDLFDDVILDRGYGYYENGNVKHVYQTDNGYTAIVRGRDMYRVSIDVDSNGDIIDSYCTCPYEDHCKHEAAVLYAIENDEIEDADEFSVEDAVSALSRDELEDLLLELAEDESIKERIFGFINEI